MERSIGNCAEQVASARGLWHQDAASERRGAAMASFETRRSDDDAVLLR